ncbi:MAG TPA: hypothetical protein VN114_08375 [Oxalicibacterium sp.]|uniref:hypothetical protein n=1 Tax=Oxalicibacterium sp. TaxID=2766525 RepID=UPI002C5BE1B4|nr:hypothetical protein [Oxalicibacterium sp.]HWU98513.1 hypothetical protein [Oxalicibacterium sp.]
MKVLAFALFFAAASASAQVKVCIGADGKKVYTDYQCEKIGMKSADVIQDINITPKQCPAIIDSIDNSKRALARHDAEVVNHVFPGAAIMRNALVQGLEANQTRYYRECVR